MCTKEKKSQWSYKLNLFYSSSVLCKEFSGPSGFILMSLSHAHALHKIDSDEDDFSLSGLTQNTFISDPIIFDDDLSIISSILECENLDFGSRKSTSADTSHSESTITRNISLISDEELEKMKEGRIPLNTKQNTAWAVRTWKEWADEGNDKAPANEKVEPDICKVSDVELGHWLAKFVVEARKKTNKGECYPTNTLYQLCCALLRYLRNNGRLALNFFARPKF